MTMKVYLAGLIDTNVPQSLMWRASLRRHARDNEEVELIDPTSGHGDLVGKSNDGGITVPDVEANEIMLRDFRCVIGCDVVIANLNRWHSKRAMVGTFMELSWAWEHRIPVLSVCHREDYLMRRHPFIASATSQYFETVMDAYEHALTFHLPVL